MYTVPKYAAAQVMLGIRRCLTKGVALACSGGLERRLWSPMVTHEPDQTEIHHIEALADAEVAIAILQKRHHRVCACTLR
jgi:hypothetical protein